MHIIVVISNYIINKWDDALTIRFCSLNVNEMVYLGCKITSDSKSTQATKQRIELVKTILVKTINCSLQKSTSQYQKKIY